jgi:hypothetical protein
MTRLYETTDDRVASRTVDWWRVHKYVLPLLTSVGTWPMAGTVTWSELDADDPAKRAALYDFARHYALRVDTGQAALAEASRDVSAAADWSAISRNMLQRNGTYIPRKAS